jgi:hypothetical protein
MTNDGLSKSIHRSWVVAIAAITVTSVDAVGQEPIAQAPGNFTVELTPKSFEIAIDNRQFASFVFDDPLITRPYFANVYAPGGARATRRQPPVPGQDLVDHPTFHPGIWMAFGDVGGADTWRLKAPVTRPTVTTAPVPGPGPLQFAMRFSYLNPQDDVEICSEMCRIEVHVISAGYLLLWDSTFSSPREFYFGDQEEMGLGLRVATPLRAQQEAENGVAAGTGEIRDAEDRRNEREVWGNSAQWCDYAGVADGQRVGMAIFCHPDNFRPSWFHARDRGLLAANPFGRAAFHKGEPSKVVVKPGDKLRLRYGVLIHAGPQDSKPEMAGAYRNYVELTAK